MARLRSRCVESNRSTSDVRAAQARTVAQGSRVDEVSRRRWPQLSVQLEASFADPTLPGSDLRAGLGVALPLFGRGADAQAAAEAVRDAALAEQTAAQRNIARAS